MKLKVTMFLAAMLVINLTIRQAMSATICGVAQNAQGVPIRGIQITVKESSGKVLGQSTTGDKGEYEIDNLGLGTLDLFLDPGTAGVPRGGSGVLNLSGASQMVNWQVSPSGAVASQGGSCLDPAGPLAPAEWAAIGVLGLGVPGGVAAIVWAETGNSEAHQRIISSSF
jgi:hypothetical protein